MLGFPTSPGSASTFAGPVDLLLLALLGLSALFALPILILIVSFGVRYRRNARADRARPRFSHTKLELAWSVIPFCLSLGIFGWAGKLYVQMYEPPPDAMEINVVGKQWFWEFQHPEGRRELGQLHIPVGRPVRLNMTSEDVIHSFYVPAFRVKQDVLPGRYTTLWFEATETGEFPLRCAQYCGLDHAIMGGTVIVMTPADYAQWLSGTTGGALSTTGAQ